MPSALLLRPTEAADLLGIGLSKIYQLVRSGELAAVKVGGQIRIPRYVLDDYVARLEPLVRREDHHTEAVPTETAAVK